VLAPMPIMGKYYMHYGAEFLPPRELGRRCAARLVGELVMDNLGVCRFHRKWAEEMLPEIVGSLWGLKDSYVRRNLVTASRINSRNASVYWESKRCLELTHSFLRRRWDVEQDRGPELERWLHAFDTDRSAAGLDFWFEMAKGISESLREM